MSNKEETTKSGISHSGVRERRKPRYSANIRVLVFTKGLNHFEARKTANISTGGLFICTELKDKFEIDEKLHIRIILDDRDAYFEVKTKVVWVCPEGSGHPSGLGLEYTDVSDDQKEIIDKILKDYINVK
jgi:Tfp pilus assembly protein PilZ